MDMQAAIGGERALRRIMALLVALAVLAERAAATSWPVRCLVLWILRRAETVAGEFVFEAAGMKLPAIAGIAAVGNGPVDALRLAARFHALAALLGALLPHARRAACRSERRGFAFGPAFGPAAPGSGRPCRPRLRSPPGRLDAKIQRAAALVPGPASLLMAARLFARSC
jgi:hypothetical protein